MKYLCSYNGSVNEYEVRENTGKFIAGFSVEEHAKAWCLCMNGEAYIVLSSPKTCDSTDRKVGEL